MGELRALPGESIFVGFGGRLPHRQGYSARMPESGGAAWLCRKAGRLPPMVAVNPLAGGAPRGRGMHAPGGVYGWSQLLLERRTARADRDLWQAREFNVICFQFRGTLFRGPCHVRRMAAHKVRSFCCVLSGVFGGLGKNYRVDRRMLQVASIPHLNAARTTLGAVRTKYFGTQCLYVDIHTRLRSLHRHLLTGVTSIQLLFACTPMQSGS